MEKSMENSIDNREGILGRLAEIEKEVREHDNRIVGLSLTLSAMEHEKTRPFEGISENLFLKWLETLRIEDYPAAKGLLLRVQKYHRLSFVKDLLVLLKAFQDTAKV